MSEKLALKKALFDELKKTNKMIDDAQNEILMEDSNTQEYSLINATLTCLCHHKDFIQRLIDICVGRNKF